MWPNEIYVLCIRCFTRFPLVALVLYLPVYSFASYLSKWRCCFKILLARMIANGFKLSGAFAKSERSKMAPPDEPNANRKSAAQHASRPFDRKSNYYTCKTFNYEAAAKISWYTPITAHSSEIYRGNKSTKFRTELENDFAVWKSEISTKMIARRRDVITDKWIFGLFACGTISRITSIVSIGKLMVGVYEWFSVS